MRTASVLAVAALAFAVPAASAFTYQSGRSLSVLETVNDDLYANGSRVSVESPINGDLVAFGQDVSVVSDVSEGSVLAGANLEIRGKTGDDLKAAGMEIRLSGPVAGDAVLAGRSVHIGSGATVSKDLVVAGGDVYLDGTVAGKAEIRAARLYLNGSIGRDANLHVGEVIVGNNARINGNLTYWSPKSNPGLENVTTGEKRFVDVGTERQAEGVFALVGAYFLWKMLFLFVFGSLALFFFRRGSHRVSEMLAVSPWTSLFAGISYFVLLPIAAVVFAFTVIGIPISILLFAVFALSFVFYELVGTVVWSAWAIDRYDKGGKKNVSWGRNLLFVFGFSLVFTILSGIDIILGWMAIGAILIRYFIRERK